MKLQNKVLIGVAIGGAALGAAGLIKEQLSPGTLVVAAPIDSPAWVVVGGKRFQIPAGDVLRKPLTHGTHTVELGAPKPRTVQVVIKSGRNVTAVPVFDEQCFVELDVTISHYGDTADRYPPKVSNRFRHREPFHVSWPMTERELPKSTTEKVKRNGKIVDIKLVHMLRPVPCSVVDDDAAALAALGYRAGRP